MWRWHELLPVFETQNMVTLGEGDTALLHLPRVGKSLGLTNLFVKEESSNPTGSFKARGLSAAVSKAKELGIQKVIIPTAGNAGGAMAAYAARADMQALIYMPKDTPQRKHHRKPHRRRRSDPGGWNHQRRGRHGRRNSPQGGLV